jgi:hypothetical protein
MTRVTGAPLLIVEADQLDPGLFTPPRGARCPPHIRVALLEREPDAMVVDVRT